MCACVDGISRGSGYMPKKQTSLLLSLLQQLKKKRDGQWAEAREKHSGLLPILALFSKWSDSNKDKSA